MENYLSLILIGIVVAVWRTFAGKNTVHLALSRFTIDPEAENLIVLEGRKTGLLEWILAQLKLGNMYRMHVKGSYISHSADSASGEHLKLTPMQKISSTACGYHKPIGLLILAVIVLLLGLILPMIEGAGQLSFFALLVGAVLVVCYFYNKSFYLTIWTTGGDKLGYSFKKSYIENVPVNIEKVKEAITRINELVLAAQ